MAPPESTLSSKTNKRLQDIRHRLSCIDSPHIRCEAIKQLVEFAASEKISSGHRVITAARTLALAIAGLPIPTSLDLSDLPPSSEGLAPFALDAILEINSLTVSTSDTSSKPILSSFLEYLSSTIGSIQCQDNYIAPSVIIWVAKKCVVSVMNGEMPIERDSVSSGALTYLDLLSSMTGDTSSKLTTYDLNNYLSIFFDSLLDIMDTAILEIISNKCPIININFPLLFQMIRLTMQRFLPYFITEFITDNASHIQLRHSSYFLNLFFRVLRTVSLILENAIIPIACYSSIYLPTIAWNLIYALLNCLNDLITQHSHIIQDHYPTISLCDNKQLKKDTTLYCHLCHHHVLALSCLVDFFVSQSMIIAWIDEREDVSQHQSTDYQLKCCLTTLSVIVMNQIIISRETQSFNEATICLNQLSRLLQSSNSLYVEWESILPSISITLSYLLWTSGEDANLIQQCLSVMEFVIKKYYFMISTIRIHTHDVPTLIVGLSAFISTLQGVKQTISDETSMKLVDTFFISLDTCLIILLDDTHWENTTRIQSSACDDILSQFMFYPLMSNLFKINDLLLFKRHRVDITSLLSMLFRRWGYTKKKEFDFQSFMAIILFYMFTTSQSTIICPIQSPLESHQCYESYPHDIHYCSVCYHKKNQLSEILCGIKRLVLHYLNDSIDHKGSLWGDHFLPILLNVISQKNSQIETSSKLNVCSSVIVLAIHVITYVGAEKLLVPAVFRALQTVVPLNNSLKKLTIIQSRPSLVSLCLILSALGDVYFCGDLGISKMSSLLEYNISDPPLLRATRLRIFNDMAEEKVAGAIDCLKQIQLGLKDPLMSIRCLALSCLGRLCCQDVMDFRKVWSILHSKHYMTTIISSENQTPLSYLYLAQFLREFVIRSVSPEIEAIGKKQDLSSSSSFLGSNTTKLPGELMLGIQIAELCIESIGKLLHLSQVISCTQLCKEQFMLLESIGLFLEILGRLIKEFLYSLLLDKSFESFLVCTLHPMYFSTISIPDYFKDHLITIYPTLSLNLGHIFHLTSIHHIFIFICFILSSLPYRSWKPFKTLSWRDPVEEGCSRLLYFCLLSSREQLGRRKPDNILQTHNASFSLLSKSILPFLTEHQHPPLPSKTSAMLRLATCYIKTTTPSDTTELSDAQTLQYQSILHHLLEVIEDVPIINWSYVNAWILPQFWNGLISRCLKEGHITSNGMMEDQESFVTYIIVSILRCIQLSPKQLQCVQSLLQQIPSIEERHNHILWTSSGNPAIFTNSLCVLTALCSNNYCTSHETIHCLTDFILELFVESISSVQMGYISKNESVLSLASAQVCDMSNLNYNTTDVWELSTQFSITCLVNLRDLYKQYPHPYTIICCLNVCTLFATSQKNDVLNDAITQFKKRMTQSSACSIKTELSIPSTFLQLMTIDASVCIPLIGTMSTIVGSCLYHDWSLLDSVLNIQMYQFIALIGYVSKSVKEIRKEWSDNFNTIDDSLCEASIAICQTLYIIEERMPTESHLNMIETYCLSYLIPTLDTPISDEPHSRHSLISESALVLPISASINILSRHGKGIPSTLLNKLILKLQLLMICDSTEKRQYTLLAQSVMFLTILPSCVSFWEGLDTVQQFTLQQQLDKLASTLHSVISDLGQGVSVDPQSIINNSIKHHILWSTSLFNDDWNKRLGLLLLNNIPVFPFSALIIKPSSCEDVSQLTVLKEPEYLKQFLETLKILTPDALSFSSGNTLLQHRRITLNFRSFFLSSTTDSCLQQGLLILGIIYQLFSNSTDNPKINLKHISSTNNMSDPLFFTLKCLIDLTEMHKKNEYFVPLFRQLSNPTKVMYQQASNHTDETCIPTTQYPLLNVMHSVSLISILWRSMSFLSPLQNLNLSTTISHSFMLSTTLITLLQVKFGIHYPIGHLACLNEPVNIFRHYQTIYISAMSLYSACLNVCHIHGINERHLDNKLYRQLLQNFSSIVTSYNLNTQIMSNVSSSITQSYLCMIKPTAIIFPRSIIFMGVFLIPTLFIRLSTKQFFELNQLCVMTFPSLDADTLLWVYYLQQLRRLCNTLKTKCLASFTTRQSVANQHTWTAEFTEVPLDLSIERIITASSSKDMYSETHLLHIIQQPLQDLLENILFPYILEPLSHECPNKKSNELIEIITLRFKSTASSSIIISFTEMIAAYIELCDSITHQLNNKLFNSIDVKHSIFDHFIKQLPILCKGYLVAKRILPVIILKQFKDFIINTATTPFFDKANQWNSQNAIDFAYSVFFLSTTDKQEIIQSLLRYSTLPTVNPLNVRQFLSYIFLQLTIPDIPLDILSPSKDKTLTTQQNHHLPCPQPPAVQTNQYQIVQTISDCFDVPKFPDIVSSIYGRKQIPFFIAKDIFSCEGGHDFMSHQYTYHNCYLTSRQPCLIFITETCQLKSLNSPIPETLTQFTFGAFPYPACFSPTVIEGFSRLLAHIISCHQYQKHPQLSMWHKENLLEFSSNTDTSLFSPHQAQIYLSKRAHNFFRQFRLQRSFLNKNDLSLETINTFSLLNPEQNKESEHIEFPIRDQINKKTCQKFGRNILSALFSSSKTKELIQLLSWLYKQ